MYYCIPPLDKAVANWRKIIGIRKKTKKKRVAAQYPASYDSFIRRKDQSNEQ